MAEIIEITDPSEFQALFEKASQGSGLVTAIFTGVADPVTGVNWCPDCERAKPNIKNVLLANAVGKVLMCIVSRAEWSGVATHPYKVNPMLKVRGVPTAVLINEGQVVMRAQTDEDFDNQELLLAIAKQE